MNLRTLTLIFLSLLTFALIFLTIFRMIGKYRDHKEKAFLSLMISLFFFSFIGISRVLDSNFVYNLSISITVFFLIQFIHETFHKEKKSAYYSLLIISIILTIVGIGLGIYRDIKEIEKYHPLNIGVASVNIWISSLWLAISSLKSYNCAKKTEISQFIILRLKLMAILGFIFAFQGLTNLIFVFLKDGALIILIFIFLNASLVLLFSIGMFYTWIIVKKVDES